MPAWTGCESQRGSVAAVTSSAICYKSASDCAGSKGMQLLNKPSAQPCRIFFVRTLQTSRKSLKTEFVVKKPEDLEPHLPLNVPPRKKHPSSFCQRKVASLYWRPSDTLPWKALIVLSCSPQALYLLIFASSRPISVIRSWHSLLEWGSTIWTSRKYSLYPQGISKADCSVLCCSVVSDSLQPCVSGQLLHPWGFSMQEYWSGLLTAYGEWCGIHDLWRRFSFGTRDQAWSL